MRWFVYMFISCLISLSTSYIMVTISLVNQPDVLFSGNDLLEEVIIAIAMGILIGAGSRLFEIERIPFAILLAIHFCYVFIVVLVAGYVGDWYQLANLSTVLPIFLSFFITYIIIWGVFIFFRKREVKEINTFLQREKK